MSVASFIPKVWDANVRLNYRAALSVATLSTATVSGTVTPGNTLVITSAGDVEIIDYKAAGRRITAVEPDATSQELVINQEKAYAIRIDDIDEAQAAGSLTPFQVNAANELAEDKEKYVISVLASQSTNVAPVGATVTTPDEALAAVAALRTRLSKNNAPGSGRFLIVNPEAAGLLITKLAPYNFSGADGELRNGVIGTLLGFRVIESPLLVNTVEADQPAFIAGHTGAFAVASSLTKTEALRAHDGFADVVRGLNVYGAKVITPAGVLRYFGAEPVVEEGGE